MADVNIDKFRVSTVRPNTQPANSGNVTTEPQVPVNPPGSGGTTFGGAGAGLSIDGVGKIQLGNDGAGVVDYSDDSVFENGFRIKSQFTTGTQSKGIGFDFGEAELQLTASWEDSATSDLFESYYQFQASSLGSRIDLIKSINSVSQSLVFGIDNTIKLTDSINSKGLEYPSDYSANWTDHSLVTKSWVLGQISGAGHNPVTIGSPANGLSISGTQVLTIGLASTSTTGALSSTDWNTFNNKLNLTSPITGYTVGSNTALADTDTILQAFGKVQGQINARISGTIASGQVAFGTGVNTVGGDTGLTYDSANDRFTIGGASLFGNNNIDFISSATSQIYATSNTGVGEPFQVLGNLVIAPRTNAALSTYFVTNNGSNINWRWRIISSGILESRESNSIVARTGSLSFRSDGGNGSLFFTPNGTGGVCIGPATSPTNTLDVNGTARIRTISNLGTAATSVLVPSATGVLSLRTLAELAADGGFARETAFQVVSTSGTITDLVATSNRIVFTGASPTINGITGGVDGRTLQILFLGTGTLTFGTGGAANNQFAPSGTNVLGAGCSNEIVYYSGFWRSNDAIGQTVIINRGIFNTQNIISKVGINRTALGGDGSLLIAPTAGSNKCIDIYDGSNNLTGIWDGSGVITCRGVTITDAFNMTFGTTTGTRIGTATNQRLAFYNSTPIVKPSGDILTALSNLGLVATPSITPIDQLAVKTTASADQTLPSGTLTILDYDTTVINNSTPTYTVATNGRITINTTGIYTITAGVVVEANAVTALESAFLGIFRNGDLVAISSINTTIAAGAQSGLTTSTILSLTATDIIDCRALVNSVGGVANGLARRLGTLLGANATQVNSLSITKNSQ